MNNVSQTKRRLFKLVAATAVVPVLSACDSMPKLQGGTAATQTDGQELSVSVYNALRSHPTTAQLLLEVSSVEDEVIIKGIVSNRNEISSIEDIAGRVAGVRFVSTGGVFVK